MNSHSATAEIGVDEEHVVLLSDHGEPTGIALKHAVHTSETPLHLAFSCYLRNDAGEVLITRRALTKKTWPGVWTNSFCGHPAPGESSEVAVHRRAEHELGAQIAGIRLVVPDFRYRAVDASGIVENEICPVYTATLDSELRPNPDEVAEWAWVHPADLATAAERAPFAFSPWLVLQLPHLALAATAAAP